MAVGLGWLAAVNQGRRRRLDSETMRKAYDAAPTRIASGVNKKIRIAKTF